MKFALSVGVSLAIVAILLNLFTQGLQDSERPSVLAVLKSSVWQWVLVYFIVYLIALWLRALRYRCLLKIAGEASVPSLKQMLLVTGVRNMIVDMLPARLGELGYIGLLNKGYGVKLSHCVSSLSIAIAFDFLALLMIVLIVCAKQIWFGDLQGWALGALMLNVIVTGIAIIGLFYVLPRINTRLQCFWQQRSINGSTTKSSKIFTALFRHLDAINDSVVTVKAAGKTIFLVSISFVIRILKYASLYFLFQAVTQGSFTELAKLPIEVIVSALIGGEIGASLPLPTFMSFGAYEAGSALVFHLLGVGDQAFTFITMLCVHIWSQCMEYLLGGTLLVLFIIVHKKAHISQEKTVTDGAKRHWLRTLLAVIIMGVGGVFFLYQLWAASKLGGINAPDSGQVAHDEQKWKQLSKAYTQNLDGFVVFSSSRQGNHDIYRLNLSDFALQRVTTHPNTENYARISPDGQRIVFSRAQQPWVPLRNVVAWDIIVKNLVNGEEQKIASNGTAPNWFDNVSISYVKQATQLVKVNINTLQKTTLYETGGDSNMPENSHIHNAQINPLTGQTVFTARQSAIGSNTGHWGTAITQLGNTAHQAVHNGCELTWSKQGDQLFQISPGGNQGYILGVNPKTLKTQKLVDLQGKFTHEYWPKDSQDGKYLVFGASRSEKEHEHDAADYEIFLWKVGSNPEQATRLTFHTGNDSWPDVFIK